MDAECGVADCAVLLEGPVVSVARLGVWEVVFLQNFAVLLFG